MELIEIVIATGNEHKMGEYRTMFAHLPNVKLTSMKEENINIDIVEDGQTFVDNALIKARAIAKLTNKYVLADDSGLEVFALNNFPGIYSARFMEGQPYPLKWQALNDMLKDKENKGAQFSCALALILPSKEELIFEGIEKGRIVSEIVGTNGFGYDPIFFSETLNKTFGDATDEEKNKVSHRGRALQKLFAYLQTK